MLSNNLVFKFKIIEMRFLSSTSHFCTGWDYMRKQNDIISLICYFFVAYANNVNRSQNHA